MESKNLKKAFFITLAIWSYIGLAIITYRWAEDAYPSRPYEDIIHTWQGMFWPIGLPILIAHRLSDKAFGE